MIVNKIKLFLERHISTTSLNADIVNLKFFNEKKLEVIMSIQGCSRVFSIKLADLILDIPLLSRIDPIGSATIGYFYGLNYERIDKAKLALCNFPFFYKPKNYNFSATIKSLDRRKRFVFAIDEGNNIIEKVMCPSEIITKPSILKLFGPTQSFYIGMHAGIYNRPQN